MANNAYLADTDAIELLRKLEKQIAFLAGLCCTTFICPTCFTKIVEENWAAGLVIGLIDPIASLD